MDSTHLLPVAAAQHHTEFTSQLDNPQHLTETPPTNVDYTSNSELPAAGKVDPRNRRRSQKVMADEQTAPSITVLNPRISSRRKTLVLCFDGTGNKFHGDSSDSNILKIFRMLDRSDGNGCHYYQPGIGTYVSSSSLSNSGSVERLKNWYLKAKDSAIGTTFDQHVMGAYKFLMQSYSPGDNIYMFGFSRGSYTARFLSEMLDWVGLITHGNEEMIQFAWRTFSSWKAMDDSSEEALKKQKKAYEFMVSFRETFSRPVRRIRYLGLFDTVNSVPRFENAMMSRVHMPYSAKSSAKVIRHAVSIDERRAKFRSDLVSTEGRHKQETDAAKAKHLKEKHDRHERHLKWFHQPNRYKPNKPKSQSRVSGQTTKEGGTKIYRGGREADRNHTGQHQHHGPLTARYRAHSRSRSKSTARAQPPDDFTSLLSMNAPSDDGSSDGDEEEQDVEELWFPGGHADIGGGWALGDGEVPMSHVPLVWIVREARKSGLQFDEDKMRALGCWDDSEDTLKGEAHVPTIEVSGSMTTNGEKTDSLPNDELNGNTETEFKARMIKAATEGKIHDCLAYGKGLPALSVLSWAVMEWIPFRRMDLRDDGSWKPIRWPLPRGEVRDMPLDAKIHNSAIKRMQAVQKYRPGNLIIGGGGRGVRVAPAEAGIGQWVVVAEEGDIVGERFVRKQKGSRD